MEKQAAQRFGSIAQRFDSFVQRLDSPEKQAAQDKAATQKQLQKQGKQFEAMEATLQQSVTATKAQILQLQSGFASTIEHVLEQ